jgi:hypothetical protein
LCEGWQGERGDRERRGRNGFICKKIIDGFNLIFMVLNVIWGVDVKFKLERWEIFNLKLV